MMLVTVIVQALVLMTLMYAQESMSKRVTIISSDVVFYTECTHRIAKLTQNSVNRTREGCLKCDSHMHESLRLE